ncbi:hypothetical protein Emed_002551 [Eimeria media]
MTSRKVEVRYATGWPGAVLHFEAAGTQGSCGGWKDEQMRPSSVEGWQEVSVQLPQEADRIEFVFKNKNSNDWDNPPQQNRYGRRNYLVDLERRNSDDSVVVVVSDGDAAVVYVHPDGKNKVLVVTDLDGTLIGHDEYLAKFKKHWTLHHFWRGSKLVYNTGRNLKDFLTAAGLHGLPKPDFAILGQAPHFLLPHFLLLLVGTEVYTFPGVSSAAHSHYGTLLTPEEQQLHTVCSSSSCCNCCIRNLQFYFMDYYRVCREIEGEVYINGNAFHDPLRVSVSIPTALLAEYLGNPNSRFCKKLKKDYKVCVSGGGDWRYLDLLPKGGGKLGATLYVMEQLGFTPDRTLVCGDSGNDIDMFCHPSILGCCVGNSHEVLVAFLKKDKNKMQAEKQSKLQTPVNGSKHKVQQPPEDAFSDATAEQKDPEDAEPFFLRDLTPTSHVCFSQYPCAGGIMDALRFFKFDERVNGLS